jgi:mevalonate kinase
VAALREGRDLFRILPSLTGIPVWTEELRCIDRLLGSAPAAVKPSGAGGGDCAIALVPTSHRNLWRAKAAETGFALLAVASVAEGASARIETET